MNFKKVKSSVSKIVYLKGYKNVSAYFQIKEYGLYAEGNTKQEACWMLYKALNNMSAELSEIISEEHAGLIEDDKIKSSWDEFDLLRTLDNMEMISFLRYVLDNQWVKISYPHKIGLYQSEKYDEEKTLMEIYDLFKQHLI